MNALSVLLLLFIEDRVLVLGQHFLLARHFLVPALHHLRGLSIPLEGGADRVNNSIDRSQALPLTSLLGGGDAPRDLPVAGEGMISTGSVCRLSLEAGLAKMSSFIGSSYRRHTREDPKIGVMRA